MPLDISSLLTVVGLIVAVWAIIPPRRVNDLRVRLTWLDWGVGISALLLVHYIFFFDALEAVGFAPSFGPWRWGLNPATGSYAILLIATIFISLRAAFLPLRRSKVPALRVQLERLLITQTYGDLIFLLQTHLNRLIKAQSNNYLISRMRRSLEPPPPWSIGALEQLVEQDGDWGGKAIRLKARSLISRALPTYESAGGDATHILRRLLLDEGFVRALCGIEPYFGLRLVENAIPERNEFLDLWLAGLLNDRSSVLYFEIENNQNSGARGRFAFPASNKIIKTIFANASIANELEVYRPIGNFVVGFLDKLYRREIPDRYNKPTDRFVDEEAKKDPIVAATNIFGFFVSEAVFADVKWHMWLYYYSHFVKSIDRNLEPDSSVDETSEWPTPYHYLLYRMSSQLLDWILLVTHLPRSNSHSTPLAANIEHENGNIPKSASLALGLVWYDIAKSKKIATSFKHYILEMIVSRFDELSSAPELAPSRLVLGRAIMSGGLKFGDDVPAHAERTLRLLNGVDYVRSATFRDELEKYH
jgi:hypothetical protein